MLVVYLVHSAHRCDVMCMCVCMHADAAADVDVDVDVVARCFPFARIVAFRFESL